ncbi:FeoB-associated Cys-rich membrane protein [Peptoniphilus catoniae]|nr:FeoB-associated Cys-rich membrane protein [Peptoniphilus catoniae]
MNIQTFIVLAVVATVVFFAARYSLKKKTCGCNCRGCSQSKSCQVKKA